MKVIVPATDVRSTGTSRQPPDRGRELTVQAHRERQKRGNSRAYQTSRRDRTGHHTPARHGDAGCGSRPRSGGNGTGAHQGWTRPSCAPRSTRSTRPGCTAPTRRCVTAGRAGPARRVWPTWTRAARSPPHAAPRRQPQQDVHFGGAHAAGGAGPDRSRRPGRGLRPRPVRGERRRPGARRRHHDRSASASGVQSSGSGSRSRAIFSPVTASKRGRDRRARRPSPSRVRMRRETDPEQSADRDVGDALPGLRRWHYGRHKEPFPHRLSVRGEFQLTVWLLDQSFLLRPLHRAAVRSVLRRVRPRELIWARGQVRVPGAVNVA